jgi:citrate synthase
MSQTPVFGFHSALKERLQEIVPKKQQELKDIKKKYGNEQIGTITVDQAFGGMRNMFGLVWDASLLHPKDVLFLNIL